MPDLIRLFRASRLCLGSGLILLALWAQAIAPLAALRMPANAVASQGLWTGPLGLSVICGHSEDAPALDEQPPASSACRACPLCAVGLSSPILPQAPSLARRQGWYALVWPIPPPFAPERPHRRTGQPRAPPHSS